MKKIAIMQPTYMPWIGYFGLMTAVDEFVLLDDVQFERRSWQQRNRVKTASGALMLTIPVFKKGRREQTINEVELDWQSGFAAKHMRTIESSYARTEYWKEFGPLIDDTMSKPASLLADYTIGIIEWMRDRFGIKTSIMRSSALQISGQREDRLVAICQTREAGVYISPPGARDYLDSSDAFKRANIELRYNDYAHPVYPQLHGEFVSHLSALDLLLNCGPESPEIIKSGVRVVAA